MSNTKLLTIAALAIAAHAPSQRTSLFKLPTGSPGVKQRRKDRKARRAARRNNRRSK